jgi:hypothetical protein
LEAACLLRLTFRDAELTAFLHLYGMDITINTPALLFPAISLLLLAYFNRFVALANLIRKLHDVYIAGEKNKNMLRQLHNLRQRILYIRFMQALAVFSFLCCVVCMYAVYKEWRHVPELFFATSLLSLVISLLFALLEIALSTKALELELSDIEELEKANLFTGFMGPETEEKNP